MPPGPGDILIFPLWAWLAKIKPENSSKTFTSFKIEDGILHGYNQPSPNQYVPSHLSTQGAWESITILPEGSDIVMVPKLEVLGAKLQSGWYIGKDGVVGEIRSMVAALTSNLKVACDQINSTLQK